MECNESPQLSFELKHWDGHAMKTQPVSAEEIRAIDRNIADYFISSCLRVLSFRAASGKRFEHAGRWPGIGRVGIKILRAIQSQPGVYLGPMELTILTEEESLLDTANLAARNYVLRKAHCETKEIAHFFLTPDTGSIALTWPAHLTWMSLDVLPVATDRASQGPCSSVQPAS